MESKTPHRSPRFVILLLTLFFASGISGLMYEVVWVRMLTRILGSTSYATSTVLGVFMGGLALGSWLAGRFADRLRRPLLWYAAIEIGIALAALCSLALPDQLVPVYRSIYHAANGSRALLTFGQVLVAVGVLLVPTMLMGATLPMLSAFGVRRFDNFHRYVSRLYALNTLGALVGVVSAGFILLGTVGETSTILLGSMLNIGVGITAAVLAFRPEFRTEMTPAMPGQPSDASMDPEGSDTSRRLRLAVLCAFGCNGFIALANEVIWGRMLVLYQGTSIYAFSSMLAVVLAGIGLGSWWAGRQLEHWENPFRCYARVQILGGLASVLALFLFEALGGMARPSFLFGANLKVLATTPILLLGPMALLWGVGFPLAARCYSQTVGSVGRDISALYAWNTLGSILGALAGGFVLISTLGVSLSAALLAVASAGLGCLLLVLETRQHSPAGTLYGREIRGPLMMAASVVVLAALVGDPYYRVIARRMDARVAAVTESAIEQGQATRECPVNLVQHHHSEGATGTTTAFSFTAGCGHPYEQLWINGEGMTHLCVETKLMAHLPVALADAAQKVCVICCGMGTSLKSAAVHPGVETWCVELVPAVFDCVKYYHPDAADLLARPQIHPVVDDGRNFLQMNDRSYDVITVDPAPPFYAAGTVNLYTQEFFQLAKSRLTDGGVFCLWIPPWERREVAYVMRTYTAVFEHVRVWSGPGSDGFPRGFYLLGRRTPFGPVEQQIEELYARPEVVADLREWDAIVDTAEEALALQITDGDELREFFREVPLLTDDRPYTEFPLFRSLVSRKPLIFTGDRLRTDLAERKAPGAERHSQVAALADAATQD